jgi:hypothetical protein
MVDAGYQCIDEFFGKVGELTHFGIDAVTTGIDDQAIVNLRLETKNGCIQSAKSGDTDIVKASLEAYLDAVQELCTKV